MVIETRYDYIYYTVLGVEGILKLLCDAGTIREAMRETNETVREQIWIKSLNKVFKNSKDYTVNNFRVDSAQYCDDIKHWHHRNMQHKECPVFVKYNESQPVKNEGEGHMFYLYEEEEEEEEENTSWAPPGPDWYNNGLDGLAGAGGRL